MLPRVILADRRYRAAMLAAACALLLASPQDPAALDEPLAGLRPGHPRLLLLDERLAELEAAAAIDPLLASVREQVLALAEARLARTPLERKLIGPRLLSVSRECLDRVATLGLAWRLTGDERYARGVEANLRAVAAFADWNPSHFLDIAEMTLAVALGYDWCYDALSADARAAARRAIVELGLEPGLAAYEGRAPAWWTRSEFNWNQVCNGGLLAGALAVADEKPDLAARVVRHAVRSLPHALATYEPDGAWPEGPAYWGYATQYTVFALAALDTALGHDFGLGERGGLAAAGWFPLLGHGPSGLYANFADAGERSRRRALPALFWLGHRYREPAFVTAERAHVGEQGAQALHFVWWQPAPVPVPDPPPPSRLFRGPVEIAFLRSGWRPDDAFVAFKAGFNQVNHGHLDLGSFEIDLDGVRWARDLGSDDYNLPGYWEMKEGGRRWGYYRLGSFSHNLLLPEGVQQAATARAHVLGFHAGENLAVIEASGLFPGIASGARRGIQVLERGGRPAILVQDEIELLAETALRWGMTTDAAIVLDGATATLRQDGQELVARVLAPAGAEFTSADAEQPPPQKRNAGVRRLELVIPPGRGAVTVAILLSSGRAAAAVTADPPLRPLADWPLE